MNRPSDVIETVSALRAKGEPFAIATVVRTISLTAAKAGAKATILADGTISSGWIGGGCARAAVLRAAMEAIADGKPRLISVAPIDLLKDLGVEPGEARDGVEFAKNSCPSQGTMDVFIEPIIPAPELLICGASPVALALADLGRRMGFKIAVSAAPEDIAKFSGLADASHSGFDFGALKPADRYTMVATQGRGDEAALIAALAVPAHYIGFVGSRKKAEALRAALTKKGIAAGRLSQLRSPAGLDIGAVTPDEIALSILGEIIACRRTGHRGTSSSP